MPKIFERADFSKSLLASLALALLIAGCGGGGGADSPETEAFYPAPEDEWQLVWSDEFDGSTLSASNWDIQEGEGAEVGLSRWGNNEQQWYAPDNLTVADGALTITARSEELVDGFPYTSGRIRTSGKFDFKYGRVEASIKAAPGKGLWSAFWMLPTNSPYGGWASSGEIDIMEVVNADTADERAFQTLHHGFPWPGNQQSGTDVEITNSSDNFTLYAIEWEEDEIRWYVDDEHIMTVTSDHWYSYYYANTQDGYTAGAGVAPFDVDFHLLLNLAVGGNLPGSVEDGDIPSEMVVDYVRVYNCSFGRADGGGCNSNADRALEVPEAQQPFEDSFDLYVDAASSFTWRINGESIERELAVNSFWDNDGSLTFSEVGADDASHGTVIDVQTSNAGNISINAVDGDPTTLFGMDIAGELKLDLYIDSAGTDPEGSILIKMDSGWPALGFVEESVANLPMDQWTSMSIPIRALLENPGEQSLNLSAINSFLVLEFTSSAHVQLDNVQLACGHPGKSGCGVLAPVEDSGLDPNGPRTFAGTWQIAAQAGALAVGPEAGSAAWFAIDAAGVEDRACFFDDQYVFGADGSFMNVLDGETWIEPWQGGAENCGPPVFPHDGSNPAIWEHDGSTLTLTGTGAYIGLAKANNAGELSSPNDAPNFIAYNVTFEDAITVSVGIEAGDGVFWSYKLVKVAEVPGGPVTPAAPRFDGTWEVAGSAGSLAVGPEAGSSAWWAIDAAGVSDRACFFDDQFVFGTDGSFTNVLGADTWIEPWQGGAENCGPPVSPHDGSNPATWEFDEGAGSLTLTGTGAYIGLAKANNAGELTSPDDAPGFIAYTATLVDSATAIIGIEAGAGVFWTYTLVKVAEPAAPPPIEGTWRVASEAGSLAVGPEVGSSAWWAIDDAAIGDRACFIDDEYVFAANGSFSNVQGSETWIEPWQGGSESCGAPVAPHDGSNSATWDYDEGAGSLTLVGTGAYIGLAKANNAGELSNPADAPTFVSYNVTFEDDSTMIVGIEAGAGVHWTYKLVKVEAAPPAPLVGSWSVASEAGSLAVGPEAGSSAWWTIDAAGISDRACFIDDEYIFSADGSFTNFQGGDTWVEPWQGGSESCGAPVAPHDGSNSASWDYDEGAGTVTLVGTGAYIGLPKANNGGELSSPDDTPTFVSYNVTFEDSSTIIVGIEAGAGVHWTYKLVKN
ncbi:MAG: beta-glucanase (GH16 family)/type 1 fimbria pilin [Halieaceae bacterium]|jgi:beta-glucanase (GH16 family)/type 1 fimbria pilin